MGARSARDLVRESGETLTGSSAHCRQQTRGLEDSFDASVMVYVLPASEASPTAALLEAACALAPATPTGLAACRDAAAAASGGSASTARERPRQPDLVAGAKVRQPVASVVTAAGASTADTASNLLLA